MEASALVVRFERRWDALWVRVAGEGSLANTMSYWQAILDEIHRDRPAGGLLLVRGERDLFAVGAPPARSSR